MSGSDKEVGKGRPPKKNRFGRGQRRSSGRPKGARGEKSIVREIAGEVHQVQLNGRKRSVTTFELLLILARDLAMGANLKAARWLNEYRAGLNLREKPGVSYSSRKLCLLTCSLNKSNSKIGTRRIRNYGTTRC
jgi:hypothetical protein